MSKVMMTCGMICCGKSTYAQRLQARGNAVILSIDSITLTLFPEGSGDMHDTYALRAEQYLLDLSLQILRTGADVILDWGLWTRAVRDRIRNYYAAHNVDTELHYLQLPPEEWNRRIEKRNASGESSYYVDEGLLNKCRSLFEEPSRDEVDVWVSPSFSSSCGKSE